jgi:hypothetical protein
MNPNQDNIGPAREELLAAYVDGELTGHERFELEAWLAVNPQARAAADSQRRLVRLCQETLPEDPSEEVWAHTLAEIETGLMAARSTASPIRETECGRVSNRSSRYKVLGRWSTAAAALLMLCALDRNGSIDGPLRPGIEPFPVTTTEDVDIITLHAADADRLAVGNSPLRDPIDLAQPGDIVVVSVKPDLDGMWPYVRVPAENVYAPMIVAPIGKEQAKEAPSP